jgi:cytochrome P450
MDAPSEPEPAPVGTLERVPAALSTPAAWLDPFDWYAEMRASAPVRYDESRRAWDLFRYEDVSRVLNDPETFSSDPTLARELELPPPAERGPMFETVLTTDPPRHDRLRAVVEDAFRPGALRERADHIREIAADLIDEAIGNGEMDAIDDLAYPLPVIVIAELLGVPSEDRPRFRRWSNTLVETPTDRSDAGLEAHARRQERVMDELTAYFEEKLGERRADPRDDLLSVLVANEAEGARLAHDEALGFCILLLIAGNITTTNLIGNALRCLTATPAAMARLEREPALLGSTIEEVLRYRSPVQALARIATRDVTLGEEQLRAGDAVITWLGSANRDPEAFEAPDEFRIDRSPNPHLAFGRGTHYCLGAPLARLEARIALEELFSRVTEIERVRAPLDPVRSAFIYGVQHFPVRFRPHTNAAWSTSGRV